MPSTTIFPAVGLSRAPMRFKRVDLPLPLLPLMTISFPLGSLKLTSSTAGTIVGPDLKCLTRRSHFHDGIVTVTHFAKPPPV